MIILRGNSREARRMPRTPIFELERRGTALVVTPVADFHDRSDAEFSLEVFRLLEAVGPDVASVVVDLRHTVACTSDRLLGPLVVLWNRLRKQDGEMALCGLGAHGREVLKRTRLNTLWRIYASLEEALPHEG
jgi:anti-anti-sigma regulatory factor